MESVTKRKCTVKIQHTRHVLILCNIPNTMPNRPLPENYLRWADWKGLNGHFRPACEKASFHFGTDWDVAVSSTVKSTKIVYSVN